MYICVVFCCAEPSVLFGYATNQLAIAINHDWVYNQACMPSHNIHVYPSMLYCLVLRLYDLFNAQVN